MDETKADSRFNGVRVLVTAIIVGVLAVAVFVSASLLTRVPKNAQDLRERCVSSNLAIQQFNTKFSQLVDLFDQSLANPDPNRPPPSPEVLALYAEFKKPVPLIKCEDDGR
jgi:type II secretory pathway pseudopilin PulG